MTERVVLEQWNGQRCQRLPISLAWQGEYGALHWRQGLDQTIRDNSSKKSFSGVKYSIGRLVVWQEIASVELVFNLFKDLGEIRDIGYWSVVFR